MYDNIPVGTFHKWSLKIGIQDDVCTSDHTLQVNKDSFLSCQCYAQTSASLHSSPSAHPLRWRDLCVSMQWALELLPSRTSLEQEKAQLCPHGSVSKMSHLHDGKVLTHVGVTPRSHSHIVIASQLCTS